MRSFLIFSFCLNFYDRITDKSVKWMKIIIIIIISANELMQKKFFLQSIHWLVVRPLMAHWLQANKIELTQCRNVDAIAILESDFCRMRKHSINTKNRLLRDWKNVNFDHFIWSKAVKTILLNKESNVVFGLSPGSGVPLLKQLSMIVSID